jgi:hypothetical protein
MNKNCKVSNKYLSALGHATNSIFLLTRHISISDDDSTMEAPHTKTLIISVSARLFNFIYLLLSSVFPYSISKTFYLLLYPILIHLCSLIYFRFDLIRPNSGFNSSHFHFLAVLTQEGDVNRYLMHYSIRSFLLLLLLITMTRGLIKFGEMTKI